MPISSLYSDTYTDISQWGTGLGEEDYPTIGWEEGQWDDPATEEVETTPGMDYWLDFLAGESAAGFGQQDWLGGLEDVSEAEGMQTQEWSPYFMGQPAGSGWQWGMDEGGPLSMTGDELASLIGYYGYWDSDASASEINEAMSWFTEEYGSQLDMMTFGGLYGDQLTGMQDQFNLNEANMWALYETWEEGQISLLDDQLSNINETYNEQLFDISENKRDQLSAIIASRRSSEKAVSESLKSQRQKAGRTGFGSTFRTPGLESAEISLTGLTTGAYDVVTTAAQQQEQAMEQAAFQTESMIGGFQAEQSQQFLSMEQQMEQWQLQFENASSNLYQNWAQGIVTWLMGQMAGQEQEWFTEGGGSFDEAIDFDPFGGEWNPNTWCPTGATYNTASQQCEWPPCDTPGWVVDPDTGECYDPDYVEPCSEPPGGCPADQVWAQAECACVTPSGPGYTGAELIEDEVPLHHVCPPGQYYHQGNCLGDHP